MLVTGATGYIGGRLVPRLLRDGHAVRTTVTDPRRPKQAWWSDRVQTVPMEIHDPDQVAAACDGVDTVYFLVHALSDRGFAAQDRTAAWNMRAAVERQRVERIVYLSGIVPPVPGTQLSEHISSRLEVEQILTAAQAHAVTLRAAIIIGSGSTPFEIVRQVCERVPVQAVPEWMTSCVQPIAVVDVIEALTGALTAGVRSGHYDVGGPTALPYTRLLELYCDVAGLVRSQIVLSSVPPDLAGVLLGSVTDVPDATVRALVQSLHHDMVAQDDRFRRLLPPGHELLGLRQAIARSLAPVDPAVDPELRDPMGPMPQDPRWAGGGAHRPAVTRIAGAVKGLLAQ